MKRNEPIKPASSEPLSKRVVRGVIWVFALRITNRGLGFIQTRILARLIALEDCSSIDRRYQLEASERRLLK